MFSNKDDAKAAGWFSRRHRTSEANRVAREKYQYEHGKAARQRRALDRLTARGEPTRKEPQAQGIALAAYRREVAALRQRLGV